MTIENDIRRAEASARLLRREFEKYFAGANDVPPYELETQIRRNIERIKTEARSPADQFRINALEASFTSYREMYRRRVREVEAGRAKRGAADSSETALPNPREGIAIEQNVDDRATLSLYRGLYGDSQAPAVGMPQFRRYLEQQLSVIRKRTGCQTVVFRLADSDGKPRLKAKPIR